MIRLCLMISKNGQNANHITSISDSHTKFHSSIYHMIGDAESDRSECTPAIEGSGSICRSSEGKQCLLDPVIQASTLKIDLNRVRIEIALISHFMHVKMLDVIKQSIYYQDK
jgi:hypothetical protein